MDDEDIILKVSAQMLNAIGYDVKCVKDGEAAISAYQQSIDEHSPYSVTILDIGVPRGLGAFETLKKLKEIDPFVKAVVTSGNPSDDIMIHYQKYGFTGSLVKPFNISMLKELLNDIINR